VRTKLPLSLLFIVLAACSGNPTPAALPFPATATVAVINPTATIAVPITGVSPTSPVPAAAAPSPVPATAAPAIPPAATATANVTQPMEYAVCQHAICKNGQPAMLRGVALPSLEWSKTGEFTQAALDHIVRLGVTIVRIPVNEVSYGDPAYRRTVGTVVRYFRSHDIAVDIDLHFVQGKEGTKPDRKEMSDGLSLQFWKTAAETYGNDSGVFFELYNEPQSIDPGVWANGGMLPAGYTAAGMQQMIDAVRSTGAKNVLIANGVNWGFDHSQLPRLSDDNTIYGVHIYPYPGKTTENDWNTAFGFLVGTQPVMISEFGDDQNCDGSFDHAVIGYAEKKHIPWIAWAYYATDNCKFPTLVTTWDGTPTAAGTVVFTALKTGDTK
jgi:endoglucanase